MNMKLRKLALACVSASLLTIAGCGGGGGGGGTTVSSPAASTTSVPVTVIDGAIRNATVCLDKNGNGACDGGEPSGKTDASGNVTLQVDPADVGKYPVLAVVGTDAVDADTGAVPVPFTLKAPADKPAVVSPLTTLVQQIVESSGGSTTEAETAVKSQTGLAVSLFEDFTKNSSSDGKTAATVARMVVVTTQQQSQSLAAAVGAADSSGSTISQADLEKAIRDALLQLLPQIIAAAADSAVQSACASGLGSDACKSAVSTQASSVASQTGLSTTTVATVVGVAKQMASAPATTTTTPEASASLRWFTISDVNQWFFRVFVSSAAENTPDANGLLKYREIRSRNVGGVTATWAFGSDPTRAGDLHWNGSSWVGCPFGFQNTSTVRDAQGVATSNYCDKHNVSTTKRATVDIAGKNMAEIINQIKAYPYLDGGPYGQSYANWGPQDTAAGISARFGTTTFPAGSKIYYQTGTDLSTAQAYDVQASNIVNQVSAAVAAGGDARTGSPACGAITASTPIGSYTTPATTLDGLISTYLGTPCIFNPGSIVGSNGSGGTTSLPSLNPNEWWGQSTLSIGTVGSAATG
ncbi:MAG: hypothetical protein ACRECD_11475, partial [Burkholderiaceae bacterium]